MRHIANKECEPPPSVAKQKIDDLSAISAIHNITDGLRPLTGDCRGNPP
jgi:hypothetical protein